METLFRVVVCSSFPATPPICRRSRNPSVFASLRTTPSSPVSEVADEDVLQTFFKERQLNGDFVSRLSDVFWQREFTNIVDVGESDETTTQQQQQAAAEEQVLNDDGGFLKLSATNEWVLGDKSAPINKKAIAKAMQNDSERRRKLNLLQYEAIQRELMLLSIAIGTACTGYCLITLSFQGAISYATGVLFSCLYLKLLYQHVDNISREAVPQIFRQKKSKKIGIRSQDLQDSLEKLIKGCGMALSSPRLVLPAAIYGLWILSHQYVSSDLFYFQLVPAMVGLFVYKAAALVQVSRCLAFGFSTSRASPPSATSSGLAGALCALPVLTGAAARSDLGAVLGVRFAQGNAGPDLAESLQKAPADAKKPLYLELQSWRRIMVYKAGYECV